MSVVDLVLLVQRKLLGGTSIYRAFQPFISLPASLAVVGFKFHLATINPSDPVAIELVSSHLAMCCFISEDREKVVVSFPRSDSFETKAEFEFVVQEITCCPLCLLPFYLFFFLRTHAQ